PPTPAGLRPGPVLAPRWGASAASWVRAPPSPPPRALGGHRIGVMTTHVDVERPAWRIARRRARIRRHRSGAERVQPAGASASTGASSGGGIVVVGAGRVVGGGPGRGSGAG